MGEERTRLERLLHALTGLDSAENGHERGPVIEYANIILKEMQRPAPSRVSHVTGTPIQSLPTELKLAAASRLQPTAVAALSQTNHHFHETLKDRVKVAYVEHHAANLRRQAAPGEFFMSLLTGEEAAQNGVRHCVTQLPTSRQGEALETLAMQIADLESRPGDLGVAADSFLKFMDGGNGRPAYAGPRSPLLNEMTDTLRRAMASVQHMGDVALRMRWREDGHHDQIINRGAAGEALGDLMREFGIPPRWNTVEYLQDRIRQREADGR